jgi:hypothetical protein
MSTEISWEPVSVLVSAAEDAGEEMLALLTDKYGATGEREELPPPALERA